MIANCTQSPFTALPPEPLTELARLCRGICLQREHHPETCRRSLEQDLANALAIILEKHGVTSATAEDVNRIYAAEQQRLADAVALAEVIIAKLSARAESPAASSAQAAPQPYIAPPALPARRPALSSAPGIADLLDGMLAQERNPRTAS